MKLAIIQSEDLIREIKETIGVELKAHFDQNREMRLYTINQVAKKLGMSHSTIKKLVNSGELQSTRNGRITEEAIDDFLKNK